MEHAFDKDYEITPLGWENVGDAGGLNSAQRANRANLRELPDNSDFAALLVEAYGAEVDSAHIETADLDHDTDHDLEH